MQRCLKPRTKHYSSQREWAPGDVLRNRLKERKGNSHSPFSLVLSPKQPLSCGGRGCSSSWQEPKLREGPSFPIRDALVLRGQSESLFLFVLSSCQLALDAGSQESTWQDGVTKPPALARRLKRKASGNQKVLGREIQESNTIKLFINIRAHSYALHVWIWSRPTYQRLWELSQQTDHYAGCRLTTGWHI